MHNNFGQSHNVKLILSIKKLYLKVRFPCSVSFQLKNQLNQVQTRSTYPLTDNIANVNDSIQLQFQADYNSVTKKYDSKKLSLVVYMTSSNGKVIAGSVKFDAFLKSIGMNKDHSILLEKCPDKNAKIYFSYYCEYVGQGSRKFQKSTYSYIYQLKHLSPRTNFSKNIIDSPPKTAVLDYKKKSTDRSKHERSPIITNTQKLKSYGTLSQRFSPNLQQQSRLKHSHIQSEVLYNNKEYTDVSPNNNYYSYNTQHAPTTKDNRKNIQRLKAEISVRHKEQVSTYQNKIQAYRAEVDSLTFQIQTYKTKIKQAEKGDKNSQLIIKELKEQLDKRKNKQTLLTSRISQLQFVISTKDKQAKTLINDHKAYQQQVQKERLKFRTQERKHQIKLSSLMQQLSKLQQKYAESEKSRLQATNDHNSLLNELEENEKKQQGSIRDKDKLANEEKARLNKKIQALNQKILVLGKKIEEQEETIVQCQAEKKSLSKEINSRDIKITNLENAKQQITLQLSKQVDKIGAYQKEIETYKQAQIQRNSLKKKLFESQHQISSLKQQLTRSQSTINTFQLKQSSLEQKVKQLNTQKSQLLSSQSSLKKELQKYEVTIKKLHKQNDNLQADIFHLNKTNNDLKARFQSSNRYAQELRVEFDQKITILLKDKHILQSDINDSQKALERQRQHRDNLSHRYTLLNEDILTLNQQLIDRSQKIKKLEETINEQNIIHESTKNDKQSLEKKCKQLSSTLKLKDQQIYQLKKKHQQSQKQLYLAKDKLSHLQSSYKQKTEKQDRRQKKKEEIIDARLSQLERAELSVNRLKDELSSARQQILMAKKEVEHWKFVYDQLNSQHQSTQQKYISIKGQKLLLTDKLTELQQAVKSKEELIQRLESNLSKSSQQFQTYKTTITESLENLLKEISRQEQTETGVITSFSLKGLIDGKISKLQIQMIQKRNALILKHKSKLFELQQTVELLKLQLEKHKNLLSVNETEKEQLVLGHKQKHRQYNTQLKQQQQAHNAQLKSLQQKLHDKLSDVQKLNIQLKKQAEFAEEQNIQIHILITQYESVKQENHSLVSKIQQLKNQQVKERLQSDSKFNQLSTHFEQIIARLRQDLFDKEKEILQIEKRLEEKTDLSKKLESLYNSERFEKDKTAQQFQQIKEKHQNLTTIKEELAKRLKQQYKKSSKLVQQISQLNQKLQSSLVSKQDFIIENRKLDEQLMKTQLENEKLKIERDSFIEKNQQLTTAIRQIDKSQLTKYLDEINTLRDNLIQAKSQSDLKSFLLKQHQQTVKNLKNQLQNISNDLSKKKEQLEEKNFAIDNYRHSLEESQQKLNRVQNQKNDLQMKLLAKTTAIQSLNATLNKKHLLEEQLQKRSRQIIKLKDQKSLQLSQKQRQIHRLKSQLKFLKIQSQKHRQSQDQLKKKNRQLQYILQTSNLDLYEEKRKWTLSNQREKQQIYKRIQTIEKSKDTLEEEYRFEKEQLQKEIQALTVQYNQVVDRIKQIQEEKKSLQQGLDNLSVKNDELKNTVNKLNKLITTQKEQTLESQKQLKRLKNKLTEKEAEKQSITKKYANLFQSLKMNLLFEKEKALINVTQEEQKIKTENIFSKLEEVIKKTIKEIKINS